MSHRQFEFFFQKQNRRPYPFMSRVSCAGNESYLVDFIDLFENQGSLLSFSAQENVGEAIRRPGFGFKN